jgi:putative membrane protein
MLRGRSGHVAKELVIFPFLKTLHILFVIGWMACLFVLPRALLIWKATFDAHKEFDAIKRLSIALFRFGSLMAIFAMGFGTWLWLGYGFSGKWLHLKLLFVFLLLVYYVFSGWLLFNAVKLNRFKSRLFMRVYNESPLLLVLPIIYFVVAKNA